jgi:hypothetical protein
MLKVPVIKHRPILMVVKSVGVGRVVVGGRRVAGPVERWCPRALALALALGASASAFGGDDLREAAAAAEAASS